MKFRVPSIVLQRRSLAGSLLLTGLLALAGCEESSVPLPDRGLDYFPVEAGTFRIYNVTDTTYRNDVLLPVQRYQVRESIGANDVFTDATGNKSFRVVRARRTPPATEWVADSVYVLTATSQTVSLVKDNRRTVELIFPVRADRTWNMHAFNDNGDDTITDQNRGFHAVGQPFTTTTRVDNMPVTKTYEQTVTVDDEGEVYTRNDACDLRSFRQVFARGVGPVLRHRRNFNYSVPGQCVRGLNRTPVGTSRHEVLVEYGR